MKKVKRFFSKVFRAWYATYFFVTLGLLYPFFWLSLTKEKWFPVTFKLKKFWAGLLQIGGLFRLKITWEEELPKDTPFIICPNHSSYLDIIMMYRIFPDYFVFMGKAEILNWPLFKVFFTKGMNIAVDRSSRSGSARAFVKATQEVSKGHSIVIFPEATIAEDAPKLLRFKDGAFKLAVAKQIPIVPVTFTTNYRLITSTTKGDGRSGPGTCKVIVHKPIETKGLTDKDISTVRNQTFELINRTLHEHGAL